MNNPESEALAEAQADAKASEMMLQQVCTELAAARKQLAERHEQGMDETIRLKQLADAQEELAIERKRVQKLEMQLDYAMDVSRAELDSLRSELDQARGELQDLHVRMADRQEGA